MRHVPVTTRADLVTIKNLSSPDIVLSIKKKSDPSTPGMKERIDHFCTGVLYGKLS